MGIDIHMYIHYKEKKIKGWWGFGGEISPGRNSVMFGILSAIRYTARKSFISKGIPDIELSEECKKDLDIGNWFGHSWLTTKELKKAFKWYKKEDGVKPSLTYRALLNVMETLENKGKNDVIVVFWFDH